MYHRGSLLPRHWIPKQWEAWFSIWSSLGIYNPNVSIRNDSFYLCPNRVLKQHNWVHALEPKCLRFGLSRLHVCSAVDQSYFVWLLNFLASFSWVASRVCWDHANFSMCITLKTVGVCDSIHLLIYQPYIDIWFWVHQRELVFTPLVQ